MAAIVKLQSLVRNSRVVVGTSGHRVRLGIGYADKYTSIPMSIEEASRLINVLAEHRDQAVMTREEDALLEDAPKRRPPDANEDLLDRLRTVLRDIIT